MRSATDLRPVGVGRGVGEAADAVVVGEQIATHVHPQLAHRLLLLDLLAGLALGGGGGLGGRGLRNVRQQVRRLPSGIIYL